MTPRKVLWKLPGFRDGFMKASGTSEGFMVHFREFKDFQVGNIGS